VVNYIYINIRELKNYIMKKCNYCPKTFSNERTLNIHITKAHKDKVPKKDKTSFLINLDTDELGKWNKRADDLNFDSLTSYLKDVVKKDVSGLTKEQTEYNMVKEENRKLKVDLDTIKTVVLDKLEWSLLTREEKIANKVKKFDLEAKSKAEAEFFARHDWHEWMMEHSPDYAKRVNELIAEDEENRAIAKEWEEMTNREQTKAKFLMMDEDIELSVAIIKVKKSKPINPRFREVFGSVN
jgi:hypothetical protein